MSLHPSAKRILARIEALARHSQDGPGVTRLYLSQELRGASDQLLAWMQEAGLEAHVDAVGNVIGRYHARSGGGPYLIIGSHLDSVIQGGRYDGPLGILTGLDCVQALHDAGRRLDFGIELVGFADEEGARFPATLIGSRAVAGTFQDSALEARDADGVSIREAMSAYGLDPSLIPSAAHRREDVLAYVEFHIEQGPVLESENLAVGVVTAINGQSRMVVEIESAAGHAGTVPMHLRHDPLLAACAIALAVERVCTERPNTVGTVGQFAVRPGAMNVIPGSVRMSIDVRSETDRDRCWALERLRECVEDSCRQRGVRWNLVPVLDLESSPCAPWLMRQIERSIEAEGMKVRRLPSGAGHDGMAMIELTDIAMIFLRCTGGISHNPAEHVTPEDVAAGARVLMRFVEGFRPKEGETR